MFGKVMQRQNSMPSAGIPVKLTAPPTSANSRRMSHDVSSVKVTRPKSQQQRMSHPNPLGLGARLQSISGQSTIITISFGYASNVHQYEHNPIAKTNSSNSSTTYGDEEQPSTSTFNSPQPPCHPNQIESRDDRTTEFYIRLPDRQIIPLFCEAPCGTEADLFLQSLPEKQKDRLRRFIETETPDCGEWHVWIKDDSCDQITVVSLKTLENHLRNQNNRRVKWRHVSLDKVSVYRYSVPVITTKFRLRLVHFLSRNYRCCILFVWCMVIFFISIGIVLTVVFGSNPPGNNRFSNGTTTPRAGQPFTNESKNISASLLSYATNGGLGG